MYINNPSLSKVTISDIEIYNAFAPIAWTDLDLSSHVGAFKTMLKLKVVGPNWDGVNVAFRRNGDTDEFYQIVNDSPGCALLLGLNNIHQVALVETDVNGIIEWKSEVATNIVIDIMSFWR